MSDVSQKSPPPLPNVDASAIKEIATDVFVISDRRIPLVPNIGIIRGADSVLVVDTGMGPSNGKRVLDAAKRIAGSRRLILTITHFHPEHAFGAQAFKGAARITYNSAQRDELRAKGQAYLDMFQGFGPGVAQALVGTEVVMPDDVYDGASAGLDLGGRKVELRNFGLAHTRGDQIVWLPSEKIVFMGDLAEQRIFPIFPWFPPNDADLDAARWAEILSEVEGWKPKIVVPGHGDVGGREILAAVRNYMGLFLRKRVAAERKAGKDADAIVTELAPKIRAEHPDWELPEWIDFAIRYYSSFS